MKMTWDLGMDHVRSWVLSGDYELDNSFDRPFAWSSTVVTGLSEAAIVPQPENASAHSDAGAETHASQITELTAASTAPDSFWSSKPFPTLNEQQFLAVANDVDDPLIPKQLEVRRIFHNGRHTWQQLVSQALTLPRGTFPSGLDPSIMLQDMPPLPESLPSKGVLAGAPTWLVPDPEPDTRDGADLDLDNVTGTTKYFRLSYPSPINCIISPDPSACHYGNPSGTADASNTPQGLAILTMCWSYILSTRLLQLQNRKIHFTDSCLRPVPINTVGDLAENEILVHLPKGASFRLVHWLCAILAPQSGWTADDQGGLCTPWDAAFASNVRFVIAIEGEVLINTEMEPPTPTEATDLLIEFCNLFGIGHEPHRSKDPTPLSPIKAAFLATLAIPFYRMAKLEPHLPWPSLKPRQAAPLNADQEADVHRYTTEARYYMTLSMHPYALGPVLWSIFWQPEIQCNVVSPWLAAITSVIEPAFRHCDFEMLIKIFLLRRPRVAMWWHGLFLLGNSKILHFIRNYLTTLDEGCSYDTLSRPDIVTSVWTGAPQSYQDETTTAAYHDLSMLVPRAALLQHRHTLTLRDPWPLFYGWLPFGSVPKGTVEPDLYPWLERGHHREYRHWTWWSKDDASFQPSTHAGYRQETGRFDPAVPDNLKLLPSPNYYAPIPPTGSLPAAFEPSRRATLQMINHSLGNIIGERSLSTAVIPELKQSHPWLKDWTPA
ncbi:hypothetical protein F53441_7218 [Fusarium austroafricanum]|uniref:Uncharacterized protein n=1 Tax=Fusarium austroafricanum TaxID=2364996 RepID=A0A8H4KI24_9HYPO|nr:hypothetical protein F53441_7218 [Fusarium austroafricanum]